MAKKNSGFMWECECGNIEYGEYSPEDCKKCDAVNSFTRVPEDQIEEKENALFVGNKEGLEDDES